MYSSVGGDDYKLMYCQSVCEDDMKAFNLQDVIELLPSEIFNGRSNFYLNIAKFDNKQLYNIIRNTAARWLD